MNGSDTDASHHNCEVLELRSDPQLAAEYLKIALKSLDDPKECAAGLRALEAIVAAYGDLESLRQQTGINEQALRRAIMALQT